MSVATVTMILGFFQILLIGITVGQPPGFGRPWSSRTGSRSFRPSAPRGVQGRQLTPGFRTFRQTDFNNGFRRPSIQTGSRTFQRTVPVSSHQGIQRTQTWHPTSQRQTGSRHRPIVIRQSSQPQRSFMPPRSTGPVSESRPTIQRRMFVQRQPTAVQIPRRTPSKRLPVSGSSVPVAQTFRHTGSVSTTGLQHISRASKVGRKPVNPEPRLSLASAKIPHVSVPKPGTVTVQKKQEVQSISKVHTSGTSHETVHDVKATPLISVSKESHVPKVQKPFVPVGKITYQAQTHAQSATALQGSLPVETSDHSLHIKKPAKVVPAAFETKVVKQEFTPIHQTSVYATTAHHGSLISSPQPVSVQKTIHPLPKSHVHVSNPAPLKPQQELHVQPNQKVSGHIAPVVPSSLYSTQVASSSVHTAPISAGSVHTAPISAGSVHTAPIVAVHTAPIAAVHTAPIAAGSAHTAPIAASSLNTAPIFASSLDTAPIAAGSVHTAPIAAVHTAPIAASSLHTAPIAASSLHTVPIAAGSVHIAPVAPALVHAPQVDSTKSVHDELVAAFVAALEGKLSQTPGSHVAAPAPTHPQVHTYAHAQMPFGSQMYNPYSQFGYHQQMMPAHLYPAYMQEMLFGDTQDPPDPTVATPNATTTVPETSTPAATAAATVPVTVVVPEPTSTPVTTPEIIPIETTTEHFPTDIVTTDAQTIFTTSSPTDVSTAKHTPVTTEIPLPFERKKLTVEPLNKNTIAKLAAVSRAVKGLKGNIQPATRAKLLKGIKDIVSRSKVDFASLKVALTKQLSHLKAKAPANEVTLEAHVTDPPSPLAETTLPPPKPDPKSTNPPPPVSTKATSKIEPVPVAVNQDILHKSPIKIRSLVDAGSSSNTATLESILKEIASQSKGRKILPKELKHINFGEIAKSLTPKGTDLATQLSDPNFINVLREIVSKLHSLAHAPAILTSPDVTTQTPVFTTTVDN